jgi:hypothetical protein
MVRSTRQYDAFAVNTKVNTGQGALFTLAADTVALSWWWYATARAVR